MLGIKLIKERTQRQRPRPRRCRRCKRCRCDGLVDGCIEKVKKCFIFRTSSLTLTTHTGDLIHLHLRAFHLSPPSAPDHSLPYLSTTNMGQIPSLPYKHKSAQQIRAEDESWLQRDVFLQSFDVSLLTQQLAALPPLTLNSILSDKRQLTTADASLNLAVNSEQKHLAEIFGLGTVNNASLVSREIHELNVSNISADNTLGYTQDRAIVLQRFYHAHRRQVEFALQQRKEVFAAAHKEAERVAEAAAASASASAALGGNGMSTVEEKEGSTHPEKEDEAVFPLSQPEGFFVASSIEMSLVLARSMAMTGSSIVVTSICHTLLHLMEKSQGAIFEGIATKMSWTRESLHSIEKFAKEISQDALEGASLGPNERSMGSALELALALQHGKLPRLLRVAQQLFAQHGDMMQEKNNNNNNNNTAAASTTKFPPSVSKFIQSIAQQEPSYSIESFEKKQYLDHFNFVQQFQEVTNAMYNNRYTKTSIVGTAAARGYVYILTIHDNTELTQRGCTLFKVGTGHVGTDKDRIYVSKSIVVPSSNAIALRKCGSLGYGRWFVGCLSSPDRVVVMRGSAFETLESYDCQTLTSLGVVQLLGGNSVL